MFQFLGFARSHQEDYVWLVWSDGNTTKLQSIEDYLRFELKLIIQTPTESKQSWAEKVPRSIEIKSELAWMRSSK